MDKTHTDRLADALRTCTEVMNYPGTAGAHEHAYREARALLAVHDTRTIVSECVELADRARVLRWQLEAQGTCLPHEVQILRSVEAACVGVMVVHSRNPSVYVEPTK